MGRANKHVAAFERKFVAAYRQSRHAARSKHKHVKFGAGALLVETLFMARYAGRQNPAAPKKIPRHIRRIGNKFASAHFVYFFRGDKRVGKIALGASVRP